MRPLKIVFNADVSDTTPWKFWPTQPDILVIPGETALAFYTVKNKTDKAIMGVATYNVHPPKAGLYFNKIQCFCFDEQRLKPKEEIDMPVRCVPALHCLLACLLEWGCTTALSAFASRPTWLETEQKFMHTSKTPPPRQVFFFIDPEILNDPSMDHVHEITLSYTFFKTDEDNQEEIQRILEQNRGDGPAGSGGHHQPVGKLATAPA